MSFEQRLRSTLNDAGSRIETADQPKSQPGAFKQPGRSRRPKAMLAFAAGFAAVLVFGLVSILVSGDTVPDIPEEVGPLDPEIVDVLDWSVTDSLPEDHVIHDIAEGPGGWLALASRFRNASPGDYLLLRSTDGVEWTRLDDASVPALVGAAHIVGSDESYFVYGLYAGDEYQVTTTDRPSNFAEPAVWTSDDGVDWELHPLPLPPSEDAISEIVSYQPSHLATNDGQAIVLGVEFDEDLPDNVEGSITLPTRPIMWESTSPGEWQLVDAPDLQEWSDIASGPGGIVAVGGSETQTTLLSWTGDRWDQTAELSGNGFQANLAGNDHGYLLRTTSGILYSADTSNWNPVDGPTTGTVLAGHSGGFTAIEGTQESTAIWWSPEGTSWTVVGTQEELGDDLSFIGAAATQNSVLTYGQTQADTINDVRGFLQIGIDER